MIQYDLEVVETIVDDYSGKPVTNGWTIIRNSDGLTRHVEGLTEGALNVLAEALGEDLGGREAAYRAAVKTLQNMLNAELAEVEADQESALLLAQQADVILSDGTLIDHKTSEFYAGQVVQTAPGSMWWSNQLGTITEIITDDSSFFDYYVQLDEGGSVSVYADEITPA